MKILRNDLLQPSALSTPAKPGLAPEGRFQSLLDQALRAPGQAPEAASALMELPPVYGVHFSPPAPALPDRTRSVIDLLERYAKDLADPSKSLRDLAPDLSDLVDQAGAIDAAYASQEEADPELGDIIKNLLVTVHTEEIRFKRGDYAG